MKKGSLILNVIVFITLIIIYIAGMHMISLIDFGVNVLLETTFYVIWNIILIFSILTYINILKDLYSNKKGMNPFKKYDMSNEIDLFEYEISKLPTYQKIIRSNNGFIVINEAGIFELRFDYTSGRVKGNINDKEWFSKNKRIKNPFILKKDGVIHYLVLNGKTLYEVNGVRLVSKGSLLFMMEKQLQKKKLSIEQIDKEYELYGNN